MKRILHENSALYYIQQVGNAYAQTKEKDFWEWQMQMAEPVKCVSYKSIPELKEIVDEFLLGFTLKKNECYTNAIHLVWEYPEIEYVEGIADLVIPLDHAWNCYKGKYFDLTSEILLKKNVTSCDYAKVVKLSSEQTYKYASKTRVYGGYILQHWLATRKKK